MYKNGMGKIRLNFCRGPRDFTRKLAEMTTNNFITLNADGTLRKGNSNFGILSDFPRGNIFWDTETNLPSTPLLKL